MFYTHPGLSVSVTTLSVSSSVSSSFQVCRTTVGIKSPRGSVKYQICLICRSSVTSQEMTTDPNRLLTFKKSIVIDKMALVEQLHRINILSSVR